MPVIDSVHAKRLVVAKESTGRRVERIADDEHTRVVECDEATIEGGVQMRCQQDAVIDIQAFRVRCAISPGLDVTGSQEFANRESGHGTTPLPQVQQALPEDVLADPLLALAEN
jgi:hypothetical protein